MLAPDHRPRQEPTGRTDSNGEPLRICLLSYRSNPYSGGQGVYLKNLSRALRDLGHAVDVVSGPPNPCLDQDVKVHYLPSLDLYRPEDPFRTPTLRELASPINLTEWIGVSTMGFPEPFTFGLRAYRFLRHRFDHYDVVHDNQSLSYGVLAMQRHVPTVATIHHPITVDRDVAVRAERNWFKKAKWMRWYSFVGMQKRVSRRLSKLLTVSECARTDISEAFRVPAGRFRVVPNGIDTELFYPIPEIERSRNRVLVTNSSDIALKGLAYLLEAVAELRARRPLELVVVGTPKKDGAVERLVRKLRMGGMVRFTGRVDHEQYVRLYAETSVAVVPSVYEGFGLPAGEAMACGVPVISTTGGALPEVVGDAGILVPPADPGALASAIDYLLDHPDQARELGVQGLRRVQQRFTWRQAAERTTEVYREAMRDHGRFH